MQDAQFSIIYEAETQKDTIINLTNHSYFNLGERDILSHDLKIYADNILETNKHSIPTGEIRNILNSPFDFTSYKRVGQDINVDDAQLNISSGYDINYIINRSDSAMYINHPVGKGVYVYKMANLRSQVSGIMLEVLGSQPGMQLYSSNYLSDIRGKGESIYGRYQGLCLETQHYPDSPNHKEFPSTLLKAGNKYQQAALYKIIIE